MDKLGLELGKNFLKSQFGGGSSSSGGSSSHRGGGGSGGRMTNSEFMREAKKFASSKDFSRIDPRALEFAATKIQAGWKGYQVRKNRGGPVY